MHFNDVCGVWNKIKGHAICGWCYKDVSWLCDSSVHATLPLFVAVSYSTLLTLFHWLCSLQ